MLNVVEFCEIYGDSHVQIVDLRRGSERDAEGFLERAVHLPMEQFAGLDVKREFDSSKMIVFHCKGGGRAARAAKILRDAGF